MNNELYAKAIVRSEEELISIYKDAYIKLLERMSYNTVKGLDNRHIQALISDVTNILQQLSNDTVKWSDTNTPDLYNAGVTMATDIFAKMNITGSFSQLNRSAIEIMSADLVNDLSMGINNTGRTLQNELRRIALQTLQSKMLFGQNTATASKTMFDEMVKNSMTALKDRQGKRWNLLTYSTMVIRTKTREIVTRGTVNTMLAAGDKYNDALLFDLVRISTHVGSCHICIPYQGKVYSLSGANPNYPKIPKMTPFHPNCRHVVTPFFEILFNGDIDKMREFSNTTTEEEV